MTMLRLLAALVALAALILPAHASGPLDRVLVRPGTLTVGVKSDYAPFSQRRGGRFQGYEVDIARRLAHELGLALRLVEVTSANRFDALPQRKVDMLLATVGDTEARRRSADKVLVQPHYYVSGTRLLLRRGREVESWDSLDGLRLCGLIGNYSNLDLRQLGASLMLHADTVALQNALSNRVCDGWAYDNTRLEHMEREPRWADFRVALPLRDPTYWSAVLDASAKGNALHRAVVARFARWHADGVFMRLASAWRLESGFLEERRALFDDDCGVSPPVMDRECRLPGSSAERHQAATAPLGLWLRERGVDLPMLVDDAAQDVFLGGMALSLLLAGTIFVFAFALGTAMAWTVCIHPRIGWIIEPVMDLSRMTPPALQILLVFYVVIASAGAGAAGWSFWIAVAALGLYGASISANSVRGSYRSLLESEWPSRGHRFLKSYQMALPMVSNAVLTGVKASPMAAIILTPELVSASRDITLSDGAYPWETYVLLLLFFIALVAVADALFSWLERRGRTLLERYLEGVQGARQASEDVYEGVPA